MHFQKCSDTVTLETPTTGACFQHADETAAHIRTIVGALRQLGVPVAPSSRLLQYAQMFERSDDLLSVTLDNALLEVLQFSVIARALQRVSDIWKWRRLVESAVTGHMQAQSDKSQCRSRSDQFELYLMAWLSLTGFAVRLQEPDLRAMIDDEDIAFAAKRLRSVAKLNRNLKDAVRQLAKQRMRGFVVVDLSFVNHFPKPVYVPKLEQQQALAAIVLDGFARRHEAELLRTASEPGVLGVLLHASAVGRSVEPLCRFTSRRWIMCAYQDSPQARRVIAGIQGLGRTKPEPHGPKLVE